MSDRNFYTVRQAEALVNLGRKAICAAIDAGEFPGYKVGDRYLVSKSGLDAFLAGTWVPFRFVVDPELAGDEWRNDRTRVSDLSRFVVHRGVA